MLKPASRSLREKDYSRWKQSGGATFLEHYAGRHLYIRENRVGKLSRRMVVQLHQNNHVSGCLFIMKLMDKNQQN